MSGMRFGTGLPGVNLYPPVAQAWESTMTTADFQTIARAADELGFDSISIPEHIVVPTEMVELMGPFWSHAMTAMAFVAGATSRLIVDSAVIVVPYHHPVVMAKAVSTLDLLSGGRLRLSVGVGHAAREFEVLGVPYAARGRITDEHLAAMIELWTSEHPVFHGEYVDFEGIAFEPKPVQRPHPPIIIGGNSRPAMRRAARHDGWFPWLITVDELAGCLDYIRSLPEFEARTRPFDVVMPLATLAVDEEHRPRNDDGGRVAVPAETQAMIDAVGRLQETGVTRTTLPMPPARSLAEHLEGMQWVAEEVIPAFR
jgi:probable F420-dependent oxidoreductase